MTSAEDEYRFVPGGEQHNEDSPLYKVSSEARKATIRGVSSYPMLTRYATLLPHKNTDGRVPYVLLQGLTLLKAVLPR